MTVNQVIEYFGSKAEVANKLGISYQAVQQWDDAGKIPKGRQFQIQVLTNGELEAESAA